MSEELKILIADDEWVIRDGLLSFQWENFGCRVVGEAEDGEEALALARVLRPDIILSDIKMPGIDGLELSKQILKFAPNTEVVLLTGYDSFDFAQTALRIGVYDYLLKPTNFHDLERIIKELCTKINQRNSLLMQHDELVKRYEKAMPMLLDKLTYDMIHNRLYGKKDLEQKLILFGIKIEKYLLVTVQMDFDEKLLNQHMMESWLLEFGVCNICQELLQSCCEKVLADNDAGSFNFILLYSRYSSDEDCIKTCSHACAKIQKAVRDYIDLSICFGISNVGTDPNQVNRFYHQAYEACRQKSFFDGECIIQYQDITLMQKENWSLPDGQKQLLFNAILSGSTEEINSFFLQLREELSREMIGIDTVRTTMIELIIGGVRVSEERQTLDADKQKQAINNGIEAVYSCDTMEKLLMQMKHLFVTLAQQNGQVNLDYHQRTVARIIRYINENYQEDLSLDLLSENFHLSNAYISRLIKKHTYKSFLDILTDVRMERAKHLVNNSKYKVYEIAEMVGYHDFSYFIQVFKKKYGKTPKECKNII